MMTKTKPRQSFAAILRTLRLRANLTLTDLSAAAGVSRTYLGRLESGQRAPSLDVACRLARALGVGVETFTV